MSIWRVLKDQYAGIWSGFSLYWNNYGGVKHLITSPYLHVAILISFIARPFWMCPNKEKIWFDITLSILPNILGFTLGGYAILLAFGDEKFLKSISGKEKDGSPSLYMVLNGALIHFIVIQCLAIVLGVIGAAWEIKSGWYAAIGFTAFVYAILTSVAAAMAVLEMADLFDSTQSE